LFANGKVAGTLSSNGEATWPALSKQLTRIKRTVVHATALEGDEPGVRCYDGSKGTAVLVYMPRT